ncbi:MAG: PadR family transcriptional regulator [Acidobacteria bacterium]|nr:PadR family transcriptional regulator [Acidobacteriota bacterium]
MSTTPARPPRPTHPARPKGAIALTALCLLAEQPCHPYELQRLLRWRHKDYAADKTRALYRAIEELTAAGYIEPVETSREGRRPERTVYHITDLGREALEDWLADLLERPVEEHPVFNVAVGLLAYMPQDHARDALKARTVSLRAELAARAEATRLLQEQLGLPRIVLLENEHIQALREAELRWVAAVLDDIEGGRLAWSEELLRRQFQAMADAEAAPRRRVGEAQDNENRDDLPSPG